MRGGVGQGTLQARTPGQVCGYGEDDAIHSGGFVAEADIGNPPAAVLPPAAAGVVLLRMLRHGGLPRGVARVAHTLCFRRGRRTGRERHEASQLLLRGARECRPRRWLQVLPALSRHGGEERRRLRAHAVLAMRFRVLLALLGGPRRDLCPWQPLPQAELPALRGVLGPRRRGVSPEALPALRLARIRLPGPAAGERSHAVRHRHVLQRPRRRVHKVVPTRPFFQQLRHRPDRLDDALGCRAPFVALRGVRPESLN
mmetsp:Transcript_41282/g.82125  ORF Transcript_41282/g.82125 Transcript_41282/m.82125 type:complete len:256 (-) Transcript_41282:160-927(-)